MGRVVVVLRCLLHISLKLKAMGPHQHQSDLFLAQSAKGFGGSVLDSGAMDLELQLDSQPCGQTVLDDPGPFHPSDDNVDENTDDVLVVEEQLLPTLPVEMESAKKRQKVDEPITQCKDQIKWVGSVPFVLDHATQKIHCGNAVMRRTKVGGMTIIHCLTNCCILEGHSDGEACVCFCHLLAKSYQHQWPTSIEG